VVAKADQQWRTTAVGESFEGVGVF